MKYTLWTKVVFALILALWLSSISKSGSASRSAAQDCRDSIVAQQRIAFMSGQKAIPNALAKWHLFKGHPLKQLPHMLEPYDINMPLFSDYTHKRRFVWLPQGSQMKWKADGTIGFPPYTLFVKTFLVKERVADGTQMRLLETRLLYKTKASGQWRGVSYQWSRPSKSLPPQATLSLTGDVVAIFPTEAKRLVSYIIPNRNQCRQCHKGERREGPIGFTIPNLNRPLPDGVNQLTALVKKYYLSRPPSQPSRRFPLWSQSTKTPKTKREQECVGLLKDQQLQSTRPLAPQKWKRLDACVRAYLHVNCHHCHQKGGAADSTKLVLNYWRQAKRGNQTHCTQQSPVAYKPQHDPCQINADACDYPWGISKTPVTTVKNTQGVEKDLDPGHPSRSLLLYRLQSNLPSVKMPPLGRQIEHREANQLVRRWIMGLHRQRAKVGSPTSRSVGKQAQPPQANICPQGKAGYMLLMKQRR